MNRINRKELTKFEVAHDVPVEGQEWQNITVTFGLPKTATQDEIRSALAQAYVDLTERLHERFLGHAGSFADPELWYLVTLKDWFLKVSVADAHSLCNGYFVDATYAFVLKSKLDGTVAA